MFDVAQPVQYHNQARLTYGLQDYQFVPAREDIEPIRLSFVNDGATPYSEWRLGTYLGGDEVVTAIVKHFRSPVRPPWLGSPTGGNQPPPLSRKRSDVDLGSTRLVRLISNPSAIR